MHLIGRATTRVRSPRPDQGRAIRELLIVASILSALLGSAWALALAHAKSGDVAMIAGYVGKSEALDDALTGERDHAALEKAARARRIKVAKVS